MGEAGKERRGRSREGNVKIRHLPPLERPSLLPAGPLAIPLDVAP